MSDLEKLTAGWVESWEKLLAQNLPFKVFLKGRDLTYLACNENYAIDHGLKPSEILGRSDYDLYPRELAETYRAEDLRILETGRSETIEGRYIKDGQEHYGQTIKSLFRDPSGQVIGILGTFWDLTELVRVKEALLESEERLQRAINATQDGIWEWDIETNQEFFSPRWCEILGYSFDDPALPHTYDAWASRIHPDDYDRVIEAQRSHLEHGSTYDVDYRHRHKSGEYRWQNSKGKAVLDERGKPIKMVGSISDITDRRQTEHQIRERMKELQAFYSLSELTEREGINLDELYRELANILPRSWQYPEIAYARIVIGDREFRTENFTQSPWRQSAPVKVNGSVVGGIDVGYLEERPEQDEGPFLKEERLLINAIAERVGRITERKRTEEALQESEHRLADIIDFLPDPTFAINLKGEVIAWNRALEELTGTPKEELMGKGDLAYAVPFYGKTTPMLIDMIFQDWKEIEKNYDYLTKREDQLIAEAFVPALSGGKGTYLWGIASPLYDSSGSIVGAIESLRDISEQKQLQQKLEEMATHDFLTGLPNRQLLLDRFTIAAALAHRNKAGLAVMSLDLDKFKTINDTLGHDAGDQMLKLISTRLEGIIRASDTVARVGGDEFILVMSETKRVGDATAIAQKILDSFAEPLSIDDHQLHLSTSIGIAIYPEDAEDLETLTKKSDAAMYYSKGHGRNQFKFYGDGDVKIGRDYKSAN